MRPWQRLAYDLSQATRVAWFLGHSRMAEQLTPPLSEPVEVKGRLPTRAALLRDLVALLQQDRANIAVGALPSARRSGARSAGGLAREPALSLGSGAGRPAAAPARSS